MKTERELVEAIATAQQAYHQQNKELTIVQLEEKSVQIAALKNELSDLLSEGADVCPLCKNKPMGIKKRPGVYDVGCIVCPPFEKADMIISLSARGEYPETAVENWNAGNFVSKPKERE